MSLTLYYHTLKSLRPVQIYGRVFQRFRRRTAPVHPAPPLRSLSPSWVSSPARRPSLLSPDTLFLLNQKIELKDASSWNQGQAKLCLYNLHYFDDLNAEDSHNRRDWHLELIDRWIRENPVGKGVGWDAYPTSVRITNWIKAYLRGLRLPDNTLHSLACQVRYVERHLEYYLLGNHLLCNAKALLFAGCFFVGDESERWFRIGAQLFFGQLEEQVLADGGHFELSPMYHSLVVEDVLDVINLLISYKPARAVERLPWLLDIASRMLTWLDTMCHPDDEIVLFSDSAFEIAPSPDELRQYAGRLNANRQRAPGQGLLSLKQSGYHRASLGPAVLFADTAKFGAEYIPGHGHADTLTFELSVFGQRVIVDCGTSEYGGRPERHYQRSTSAHNTIVIDDKDSSEIWSTFRAGRRARPLDVQCTSSPEMVIISAAHDGYAKLSDPVVHRRRWELTDRTLTIVDDITGLRPHRVSGSFRIHPDVQVVQMDDHHFRLMLPGSKHVIVTLNSCVRANVEVVSYHPEFGRAVPSSRILFEVDTAGPCTITSMFNWDTQ